MITAFISSLHFLISLIFLSIAILLLILDYKKREYQAISAYLTFLALSSLAVSLELNAISIDQALPWIIVEIIAAHMSAPIILMLSLVFLRPQTIKNNFIKGMLWIVALVPLIAGFVDLLGISQIIFGSPLLIDLNQLPNYYANGYVSPIAVGISANNPFLFFTLILSALALIYPVIFVFIKDRKTSPTLSHDALIIFVTFTLSLILSFLPENLLPITIPTLLSNLIMASGFSLVIFRRLPKEPGTNRRINFFQNYPVLYKLLITTIGILLPAIIYLGFSTYGFFQQGLLSQSADNLAILTSTEEEIVSESINERIEELYALQEIGRIQTLLTDRISAYEYSSPDQVQTQINLRDTNWKANDGLIISTIMDPVKNTDLRNHIETGEFSNIVLVDQYGALITAGENPLQYDFSNANWWQEISSTNQIFIGTLVWNESRQLYELPTAIPLFTTEGEMIGAALGTQNFSSIFTDITIDSQKNIQFGISNASGNIIPSSGQLADQFTIPNSTLENLETNQDWFTYNINNVPHLLHATQIENPKSTTPTSLWIVGYQPVDSVLSPLITARTAVIIIAAVIVSIAVIITLSLAQSIINPLTKLTDAASQFLQGSYNTNVNISNKDEFGTLANTFNQLTSDLSQLVTGLEDTIEARTQDLQRRASQLETSAQVARQAAEIRDLPTLLDQSVELISEKFEYYHCGIFLLDEHKKFAVLQAANSVGGKKMLERGHKLQVGRVGVVGYCAGMGQPRIAQDVGADIVYYDNPDMPDTRSEMALPLIIHDQVIGVVDVQSKQSSAFSMDDIEVLQIMADQLAVAIDNARLVESSQKTLAEVERLYGQQAVLAWKQRLKSEELAYQYNSTGFTKQLKPSQDIPYLPGHRLVKDLIFRGQVIGNLDFIRDEQENDWSEDEENLVEEILEQTALALENARLMDQIRLRSDQIQLLQEITALAVTNLEEEALISKVVNKLQESLDVPSCGVIIFDDEHKTATLKAISPQLTASSPIGTSVKVSQDVICENNVNNKSLQIFNNYLLESDYLSFTNLFSSNRGNSLITMPITIRDKSIGFIFIEDKEENREFDLEENSLFRQLQAQISTAMESSRLFKAEQQSRQATNALLEIAQISSASLEMNRVLKEAAHRSTKALQASRCHILLLDEKQKIKPLISVQEDGSSLSDSEWDMLNERIQTTYQNIPLRTLAANLRSPANIEDPITYQKLPLQWTTDFNIKRLLMVPLISQNRVIGTMLYDQTDSNKSFSQYHINLAQTIAGQIATTIENVNLFEQAVNQAEREHLVSEITAKLRASNDPNEIMSTAITELRMALSASGKKKTRKNNASSSQSYENPSGSNETQNQE